MATVMKSVYGPSTGSTPFQYIEKLITWAACPNPGFRDSKEEFYARYEFARGQIECLRNWGFITPEQSRAFICGLNAAQKVLARAAEADKREAEYRVLLNAEFDEINRLKAEGKL